MPIVPCQLPHQAKLSVCQCEDVKGNFNLYTKAIYSNTEVQLQNINSFATGKIPKSRWGQVIEVKIIEQFAMKEPSFSDTIQNLCSAAAHYLQANGKLRVGYNYLMLAL